MTESDLPHDSFDAEESDEHDNEFWPIDKLIKGRRRKDKLEYLVKWKGCTSKDNSWVSYDDLNDEAIKYLANNNVPITGKQDTRPAM